MSSEKEKVKVKWKEEVKLRSFNLNSFYSCLINNIVDC